MTRDGDLEIPAGGFSGEIRCPRCSRLLAGVDSAGAVVVLNGDRSRITVRDADLECLRCSSVVTVRSSGDVSAVAIRAKAVTWGGRSRRRRPD